MNECPELMRQIMKQIPDIRGSFFQFIVLSKASDTPTPCVSSAFPPAFMWGCPFGEQRGGWSELVHLMNRLGHLRGFSKQHHKPLHLRLLDWFIKKPRDSLAPALRFPDENTVGVKGGGMSPPLRSHCCVPAVLSIFFSPPEVKSQATYGSICILLTCGKIFFFPRSFLNFILALMYLLWFFF